MGRDLLRQFELKASALGETHFDRRIVVVKFHQDFVDQPLHVDIGIGVDAFDSQLRPFPRRGLGDAERAGGSRGERARPAKTELSIEIGQIEKDAAARLGALP